VSLEGQEDPAEAGPYYILGGRLTDFPVCLEHYLLPDADKNADGLGSA
jgi:hypothetical protein